MREATFLRRLALVGLALATSLTLELFVIAAVDARMACALAQMIGLEIVAGREAGIPVALLAGAPKWLVAQVSLTQDLAVVSLAFPLACRALGKAVEHRSWFGRRIARIDAVAARHRAWATRWGPFGVFAFMLVPFLANGPLVAALLGRASGIKPNRLIAPVLAATTLAIAAWTYAYDRVLRTTGALDSRLPAAMTIAIVLVALGALLIDTIRERRP